MRLSDKFDWTARTYVMGILNITPDSFSGDGLAQGRDTVACAVAQAEEFIASGADILDIGAESTRPGSVTMGAAAEADALLPVVAAVRTHFPDTVISVDTYRAAVAGQALDAGADIVNDVWGLRADPDMAVVVAAHGAPVILMHNRSKPGDAYMDARLGGQYRGAHYDDLLPDISCEMEALASHARAAGIPRSQIILDPGLGFGKTVGQNLALMNNLNAFQGLGYPILAGPSRKSFIGHVLDLPVDQRVEGTAAAVSVCIARGANIIRAHDVEVIVRITRMTDAILRS